MNKLILLCILLTTSFNLNAKDPDSNKDSAVDYVYKIKLDDSKKSGGSLLISKKEPIRDQQLSTVTNGKEISLAQGYYRITESTNGIRTISFQFTAHNPDNTENVSITGETILNGSVIILLQTPNWTLSITPIK